MNVTSGGLQIQTSAKTYTVYLRQWKYEEYIWYEEIKMGTLKNPQNI